MMMVVEFWIRKWRVEIIRPVLYGNNRNSRENPNGMDFKNIGQFGDFGDFKEKLFYFGVSIVEGGEVKEVI